MRGRRCRGLRRGGRGCDGFDAVLARPRRTAAVCPLALLRRGCLPGVGLRRLPPPVAHRALRGRRSGGRRDRLSGRRWRQGRLRRRCGCRSRRGSRRGLVVDRMGRRVVGRRNGARSRVTWHGEARHVGGRCGGGSRVLQPVYERRGEDERPHPAGIRGRRARQESRGRRLQDQQRKRDGAADGRKGRRQWPDPCECPLHSVVCRRQTAPPLALASVSARCGRGLSRGVRGLLTISS